jgi:hypothetical protein
LGRRRSARAARPDRSLAAAPVDPAVLATLWQTAGGESGDPRPNRYFKPFRGTGGNRGELERRCERSPFFFGEERSRARRPLDRFAARRFPDADIVLREIGPVAESRGRTGRAEGPRPRGLHLVEVAADETQPVPSSPEQPHCSQTSTSTPLPHGIYADAGETATRVPVLDSRRSVGSSRRLTPCSRGDEPRTREASILRGAGTAATRPIRTTLHARDRGPGGVGR